MGVCWFEQETREGAGVEVGGGGHAGGLDSERGRGFGGY